jgi:glycosyltransferase involved in cell wall biosynthesis
VSRLKRVAEHPATQRALRSPFARRLTTQLVAAQRAPEDVVTPHAGWAALEREGPAPLVPRAPTTHLDVAIVVPAFRRGSGGHTTIANLVRGLEQRGHTCSIWIDDPLGQSGGAANFAAFFGPFKARVHDDLTHWTGAQVVLATGWQTVATVLRLANTGARAHLVQDDEPEFYPASAERLWAQKAFQLPTITAGTWLADKMREKGLRATPFDLGIDHSTYRPQPHLTRNAHQVLFYARTATPRRAVPLGLLALQELKRRRPRTEVVLFGDAAPLAVPYTNLGILTEQQVADAYAQAAVGVVLSLTNHSLAAQEMAACALPAVELRTPSTEAAFNDSPIVLAPPTVLGLADAIERQLDAPNTDVEWARARTWERAAAAVEAGLRAAVEA